MSFKCQILLHTIAISLLICPLAYTQEKPQRIVSLNICTDQLLLMLADKENIASITYLAANPEFSHVAELTEGIGFNRGQAEEIIPLNPDLILNSQFSAASSSVLLNRLGYEVHQLGFPESLEDTFVQIREVAGLVGETQRGEELVSQIQNDIEQSLALLSNNAQTKLAVFYSSNAFTYGSNSLRNNFLSKLGLRNLSAEAGIFGSGQLPLELLLKADPDYLLVNSKNNEDDNLAHHMLRHPALKALFTNSNIIELPDRLFQCAGPSLVEAFQIMVEKLSRDNSAETAFNE